jgi:hypothetical protein
MGNSSGIISDSILSRKKFVVFGIKSISTVNSVQVEMSGGRGKPSIIVDKDEGLGKVNSREGLTYLNYIIF